MHPGTLASLQPGEPARVATSLVVREDSLTLFGFGTDDERNVFELLQTASGIGPRLALAMLAVHSPDALRRAVAAEDVKALTMVPGVGNKGAQRIILELKDRLGAPGDLAGNGDAAVPARRAEPSWRDQVQSGLVNLGWSPRDADAAVDAVEADSGDQTPDVRHRAPGRAAEAVAAVTDRRDALTGAEEAELERRRRAWDEGEDGAGDSAGGAATALSRRWPTATSGSIEGALRPKRLDDFVGQQRVREQLTLLLHSALRRGRPPDHVLLSGPPGLGKTTIAMIIAAELGAPLRITSGPAIERSGDLAAVLSTLQEGEVVFIDEIHRLARPAEEMLYLAMEDFRVDIVVGKGPGATAIPLDIAPFTLVGATTRAGLLPAPLRDRFGFTGHLDFYQPEELGIIVRRSAGLLGVRIEDDGIEELASAVAGHPADRQPAAAPGPRLRRGPRRRPGHQGAHQDRARAVRGGRARARPARPSRPRRADQKVRRRPGRPVHPRRRGGRGGGDGRGGRRAVPGPARPAGQDPARPGGDPGGLGPPGPHPAPVGRSPDTFRLSGRAKPQKGPPLSVTGRTTNSSGRNDHGRKPRRVVMRYS